MTILRAETMGMCGGVRRALRLVEQTLSEAPDTPVFSLGPIVHNPGVVQELRARGVIPIDDLSAVREGTVILRAHGVGPAVREQCRIRGLHCVDATCPNVARTHRLVADFATRGFSVIVVGEPGHAEVAGILGHASGARAIASAAEAEAIPLAVPSLVVAQTTFVRSEYYRICNVLKARMPDIIVEDTTCRSTEERKESLLRMALEVEALLVIGARQSANTRWLHQAAQTTGKPSWLVESIADVPVEVLGYERIGNTAGASTPDRLVDEIEAYLHAEARRQ
jgi:(E)-4-hydroxy-3-methyl-but-2-enyl pyrophosphate reductase